MKIETVLDHQTILENRRPTVFFAVRLHAPDLQSPPAPSAAYCLVIDQSPSIEDSDLTFARRFAVEFIRHLPANALLSIVTFAETANTIYDLATIPDKSALQALVNDLAPVDGATNLSAALLLAREQLHRAPQSVVDRKLILFTDGEHTAGVRDETLICHLASDCRAQGIHISTIHLGKSNPEFIDHFSSTSYRRLNGEHVAKIIQNEIGSLQRVVAQNIRLRLKALDFCERIEPLGFEFSERSDGWLTHSIGDLLSNEERTLCFNLTIPLLPCIDDQPCASLANEALVELEAGYEAVGPDMITPKRFSATIRIPAFSNTYPSSEDGTLTLREDV